MSKNGLRFLIVSLTLVALGVVMIYSASSIFAYEFFKDPLHFLKKQLLYAGVGFVLMFAVSLLDPLWLKKNSLIFVAAGVFVLLLVYVPVIGISGGGARRWLNFGLFHLQPAEFIKIIITLYLADYLSRRHKEIQKGGWRIFFPPLVVLGMLSVLVLAQPDLGSVIIYFMMTAVLFFLSGIRIRYIVMLALIVLPAVVLLVVFFPYRMARITSFINPWNDPKGGGFQIIQSFIAFGSGGWSGVGLGGSAQKLFYLPQSFTDFIFSIIAEELGLIGTLAVIGLFIAFFIFGINITKKSKDIFLNLYCRGLVLLITLQAFINMMVSTGMIPTKGLPLPFISYGGSSLLMNMLAVGLILGVDRKLHRGQPKRR